jgi:3-phenylpropionate/trans-cinnamate dioxygenase ferredoxin subunit
MAEFVRVAHVEELPENSMRCYEVHGREIALYNINGRYYATFAICTHEYANLTEGWIDPDECSVECPLHGARFSIETGEVLALPAYTPLPVYPVKVEDGEIWVGL